MYAIIQDGGRQYKVQEGERLLVDYRDLSQGEPLRFERVVALRDDSGLSIGEPLVEGVQVSAEVVGVRQGPKLVIQKFRRRKNSRRKTGHRQLYTEVQINKIERGS